MTNKITNYSKIKSILLQDENIEKVIVDTLHEKIIVIPNQSFNYKWMEDPLENFKINGNINICNKVFKVINYIQNVDKVYELVLKEF